MTNQEPKKKERKIPIMKMWFEENDLFIRVKVRAGLYYFPMGEQYADFLADSYHNDWRGGRTYKFVGFRKIIRKPK